MRGNEEKYYLISGIGPGHSGVGRLMAHLMARADNRGFQTIFRDDYELLREKLVQRHYFKVVYGLIRRYWLHVRFWLLVRFIKNANILFLHPQTAGMDSLFHLVKRNRVFFYVMDSSFFCMRSYNIHPDTQHECFQCLKGADLAHPSCKPFPVTRHRDKEIALLDKLRDIAGELIFLAQNQRQADLLHAVFGNVEIQIVGMDTGEVPSASKDKTSYSHALKQSVVFHGATVLAKGIAYFIGLAERLPEYCFVVPDSQINVEQCLERSIVAKNIEFRPCSWESGLSELVAEATVVINPSLWSAPIEGALVKSFAVNDHVATVATQYGYEGEIARATGHIRLDVNPDIAAGQLKAYMNSIGQGTVSRHTAVSKNLFFPLGACDVLDVVQRAILFNEMKE